MVKLNWQYPENISPLPSTHNSLDRISICSARFEVVVINPIYHCCLQYRVVVWWGVSGGCAVALKPPGQWVLEREAPQRTLNICVVTTDWSWLHYLTTSLQPFRPVNNQLRGGDKVVLQFLLRYAGPTDTSVLNASLCPLGSSWPFFLVADGL